MDVEKISDKNVFYIQKKVHTLFLVPNVLQKSILIRCSGFLIRKYLFMMDQLNWCGIYYWREFIKN